MNIKSPSSHKIQEPVNGYLYIVGTPIGNLNDISYRAISILKNVSLIICEDTRQTKKILNKYEFTNNLKSFNQHNSFKKITGIINNLKSGKSIALVSDAGMPGICDPGEDLIKEAKIHGINIICIPGPCAVITALVSSGLPSSKFSFEGFLPKKQKDREKLLFKISKTDKTTILFESPHRLHKLLNQLKEICGGEREIQVFRELTKKYEENIGNNISEVLDFIEGMKILGEITVVIKGLNKTTENNEFDKCELKIELDELVKAGLSLSSASSYLAKKKNLTKKLIYNLY